MIDRELVSLDDLQLLTESWRSRNFPGQASDASRQLAGCMEELGELAHAWLKQDQGIRSDEDLQDKEVDAIGDLLIYLCGYCSSRGLNLRIAAHQAWKEVSERDWIKWPETGRPPEPEVLESYSPEQIEEAGRLTHRETLRAERPSLGGNAS